MPVPPTWSLLACGLVPLGQTDGQLAVAALEPVVARVVATSDGDAAQEVARCTLIDWCSDASRKPIYAALPLVKRIEHGPLRWAFGGRSARARPRSSIGWCKQMRAQYEIGVITNDIYTRRMPSSSPARER